MRERPAGFVYRQEQKMKYFREAVVYMSDLMNKEILKKGLSEEQVIQSKQNYGTNELAKKEQESLWSMFIGAFDDIWIKVLCGALAL